MGKRWDGRQTGLTIAFAFAIALVGGVGFESYRSLLASRVRAGRVSHTHQVLEALSGAIAHLQDAESGQRGLVITGDPRQNYAGVSEPSGARTRPHRR